MESKSFFLEIDTEEPPMTLDILSEGGNKPKWVNGLLAFDIETFSPRGFPFQAEDPIVNFSLVTPLADYGILTLSAIVAPVIEREMLLLLKQLFSSFNGATLLTYNGSKFDVEYVEKRGRLYGLNFQNVFCSFRHVDVYKIIRNIAVKFPRYDQKTVERCLGFQRAIPNVSGGSYHLFYNEFLRGGNLTPMFYNIEDSFGCLRIASFIPLLLKRQVWK